MKKYLFILGIFIMWTISVAASPVLIVDDDQGYDSEYGMVHVEQYYMDALDANGVSYDYHEVEAWLDDGPDFEVLSQYQVVIWFCGTGWEQTQTLNDTDEDNLAQYLDNGGNLFLVAQDYLFDRYEGDGYHYDFSEGDFPYDYFGLTAVDHDMWIVDEIEEGVPDSIPAYGADGSIIAGLSFDAKNIYEVPELEVDSELYIDQLTHNATNFFMLEDESEVLQPAAVQYEAETYKVVFSTLEFGALQDIGNGSQASVMHEILVYFGIETGVDDGTLTTPAHATLGQNYPNPFNPTTHISFAIPQNSDVSITVYDTAGNLVKVLNNGNLKAGYHTVEWNGKDNQNKTVPSGMYIYRMEAGDYTETKSCILVK
jgi:hypothetical protein